jgi:hypothetical protein
MKARELSAIFLVFQLFAGSCGLLLAGRLLSRLHDFSPWFPREIQVLAVFDSV